MNVLFVDPDEGVADGVGAVLRRKGHTCVTIRDGQEAITLAQQGDYDIVVLEIELPDMGGFDVLLRMQDIGLRTPVLLQSGHAAKSLVGKAAHLQGMEIISKPYIVTELIERMEQVVALAEDDAFALRSQFAGHEQRAATGPLPEPGTNGSGAAPDNLGPPGERRGDPRKQFIEAALITDDSGPIPCVILNLSRGGAAIKLPEADRACPSLFTLELLDGPAQRCEMRWRNGDRIGVAFI